MRNAHSIIKVRHLIVAKKGFQGHYCLPRGVIVVVVVDDVAVFWERRLLYHITHDHILQY